MIRKITLSLLMLSPLAVAAQCTTTNATSCYCLNNGQSDCDLLPDITVSGWALLNYLGGPTEYPQTGAGADNGRLRLSGSTPNIGHGPLTVGSVQMFVCGNDTFTSNPGTCPDGSAPRQLVKQKVYHKNGNNMAYTERWAGSMTYHPTHGHMHVDDWGVYTLRIEDPNEPDPRNWPIVGDGAKLGFCLMDYGTCSYYNGHCRDASNNILLNGDFQNWGLGGGQYGCSPVEQGISVGHTDIYSENLDGMWINIPPGTCNGNYWIVIEIDPHNFFLEEDETNNWAAVPFTLTQQVPAGNGFAEITASGNTHLCAGDAVTLSANAGSTYTWSTGATTQSINVNTPGTYYVTVTSPCGTAADTVVVTQSTAVTPPTASGVTICEGASAALTASSAGSMVWYDAASGGNMVGSGATFNTPPLASSTTYYVEVQDASSTATYTFGPASPAIGTGAYHTNNTRYLTFDADAPFTLRSVLVDANSAGNRVIELQDANGSTVQSVTVYVPQGQNRIILNLNVPAGQNQRLGLSSSSAVDLWRNDGGVSYPYDVANLAHITGSSAGAQFYYFFYDWEIETVPQICSSTRVPVPVTVQPAPATSISGLGTAYDNNDPAVTMTGSPAGGTFSGPGVTGNSFNPATAGIGTHTVTYSYTDANGCVGTSTVTVTVSQAVNTFNGILSSAPAVYPNPNNGMFTLDFEVLNQNNVSWTLTSMTGQELMHRDLGDLSGRSQQQIDIRSLSRGVYFLRLDVEGKSWFTKLVYQ